MLFFDGLGVRNLPPSPSLKNQESNLKPSVLKTIVPMFLCLKTGSQFASPDDNAVHRHIHIDHSVNSMMQLVSDSRARAMMMPLSM